MAVAGLSPPPCDMMQYIRDLIVLKWCIWTLEVEPDSLALSDDLEVLFVLPAVFLLSEDNFWVELEEDFLAIGGKAWVVGGTLTWHCHPADRYIDLYYRTPNTYTY